MQLQVDWVDSFSATPFGGNGCAVVHDADGLDADQCMSFVRETGLVECTFLGPSQVADWRVRYFMADREIPFAGHPTLATAAALHDRGLISGHRVLLETGAGVVPVDVSADDNPPVFTMTQRTPDFGPAVPAELVAAAGGLSQSAIVGEPRVVSTGLPFVIVLLKDKDALRALQCNPEAMTRLSQETGVMEPFWVTLGGATDEGDTFSRLVLRPPLPPEDPFTGSATGAMACYLWSQGHLATSRFVAEQGHWLGRPGQAQVEVLGPRNAVEGVRVGGSCYVLLRGTLTL